ncbi:flavin monoamine oxidase family protein [Deinococcus sp. Marseille-Q6407]|uniref:flavin monoamine oxidase family protein n=1 Tax=Deinococcus sp. Marseille-Q6407 TaxID=2969223 RepID=UPI0021BE1B0D|nr:flavin monoamine oxidase family protein [Deinococcus sp. Marseille-Q6407]
MTDEHSGVTRRRFIEMMGAVGGTSAAYFAMTSLGMAQSAQGTEDAVPDLQGSGKGKSVLILGGGLAGMSSAYELKKLGYDITILEYNDRAGGRCWTLRGGDTFTELGGETQTVKFREGNYLNPGPWRIPYHHRTYMHYAREFAVPLEAFIQVNENAYVHRKDTKKKYRIREVRSDFYGYTAELLAKSIKKGALDQDMTPEDRDMMTEAMSEWGALDDANKYVKGMISSARRGYNVDPASRLQPGEPSDPIPFQELMKDKYWTSLIQGLVYEHQQAIFQPVGGMDQMARAFEKRTRDMIVYNAKVKSITVGDNEVTAVYTDHDGNNEKSVKADYCICSIPLPVLSQIDFKADPDLVQASKKVAYDASFKAGIESRRFWETEEGIYGGISYTDQKIELVSYPNGGRNRDNTGVLLAAYQYGPTGIQYTGMSPDKRLAEVRKQVAQIHPQIDKEFISGVSVGWHRVPWVLGCASSYTDEQRQTIYRTLSARHGRIILAGEQISYWPGWQEGALLSAMTAVKEIHSAAQAG